MKFTRMNWYGQWYGTIFKPTEKFGIHDLRNLFPEIVVYKFEDFNGFIDINFYARSDADEASFIMKAKALQESE
jgi:hypothetical protein